MTKDDILYIFRTFWPEKAYEGIQPHLPGWSKSRASNFASRHGIRMNDEAKRRMLQDMAEASRQKQAGRSHGSAKPSRQRCRQRIVFSWGNGDG